MFPSQHPRTTRMCVQLRRAPSTARSLQTVGRSSPTLRVIRNLEFLTPPPPTRTIPPNHLFQKRFRYQSVHWGTSGMVAMTTLNGTNMRVTTTRVTVNWNSATIRCHGPSMQPRNLLVLGRQSGPTQGFATISHHRNWTKPQSLPS